MKHLHLTKFTLLNIGALSVLGWFWIQGFVQEIFIADVSYMSLVIVATFVLGLILSLFKLISIERTTTNEYKKASNFGLWLNNKISTIRFIANNLVLLGLIGTLIGFSIAFSGVDPNTVSGDTEAAGIMISQVLSGMSVALYTTLVGTVTHLWLYSIYKILEQAASVKYIELTEK
tara:strand:- start:1639 stop:2163 length:525 start_codon:yes stop_codon:yes gene_type:complete